MRFAHFLDKFKSIKLRGLENIDTAYAMYFCYYEIAGNNKSVIASIARLFISLCTVDVDYKIKRNGRLAFVYSNSYKNRTDFYKCMRTLVDIFEDCIEFWPGKRKLYLSNISYFCKAVKWFLELFKVFPYHEAVFYCSMLVFGLTNADYLEKLILKYKCKMVVVLSDMHLIDSLLIQKCNLNNVTTATLQHGNFELDEPFVLSKSKYFLTYGEYSKKKAMNYGMNEAKLIETGILKLIGKKIPIKMRESFSKINNVGIILSGYTLADSDTNMINLVARYCQEHDISVSVKFHPGYGKNNYANVDWTKVDTIYDNEITTDQFANIIDVAIFLNSTVFFEYVMLLIPSIIYVDLCDNFLPEVTWCKFNSYEEFDSLISNISSNRPEFEKRLAMLRSYFSASINIDKSYKDAILKLSNSN